MILIASFAGRQLPQAASRQAGNASTRLKRRWWQRLCGENQVWTGEESGGGTVPLNHGFHLADLSPNRAPKQRLGPTQPLLFYPRCLPRPQLGLHHAYLVTSPWLVALQHRREARALASALGRRWAGLTDSAGRAADFTGHLLDSSYAFGGISNSKS